MNHTDIGLSTLEDAMGRPVNNNMSLEGALREATLDMVEVGTDG